MEMPLAEILRSLDFRSLTAFDRSMRRILPFRNSPAWAKGENSVMNNAADNTTFFIISYMRLYICDFFLQKL